MGHPVDGILLVDKAEGESSFDVIRRTRRVLPGRKTGHAGTLDPIATGLLILLLGQGTKLSRFIMSQKKVYQGTLMLGVETDTLDSTGMVTAKRPVPDLKEDDLRTACRAFIGELQQRPPRYSALKVRGQRSYELARKGIDFELPERKVVIESLEMVSMDLPKVTMRIQCSAGTYVRSLFADMGRLLSTGAHMTSLRRIASGQFVVENAIASNLLSGELTPAVLEREVLSMNKALPGMAEMHVDDVLAGKIRQGYQPAWDELMRYSSDWNEVSGYVKLTKADELIAVVRVHQEKMQGITTRLVRVFQ